MKERPILFSAPMVRAILAGTKSQTRRVIKPQPHNPADGVYGEPSMITGTGSYMQDHLLAEGFDGGTCLYGQPGDRLWVRETFCIENTYDYHGDHVDPGDGRPIQKREDAGEGYWLIPHYRATEHEPHIVPYRCDVDDDKTRWTPSIFMPRWASRITLDITAVRVERLQEITRGDCMAEGCPFPNIAKTTDPRGWFSNLWQAINGPGSWEINPWVWVIEFREITP